MMIQHDAVIIKNEAVGRACGRLTLESPDIAAAAEPGRFVMVRLNDSRTPLLPRPFSIHRVTPDKSGLELLFKIVGAGTRKMAALNPGQTLNVTGPLGTGFTVPAGLRRAALVAGGMGVAPLVFLAEKLSATGIDTTDSLVFLGGCAEEDLLCRDLFRTLNWPMHITTEDGSCGQAGLITAPLEQVVAAEPPDMVFACGPTAMMAAVAEITGRLNIACQVSIETIMACGIGVCLGCAVRPADGNGPYLHACKDGPVFNSRDIDLSNPARNHC